jgi:thioredoxin reductase
VIVGGGPAGLSAALVLGRCRRRVLVCDAGKPRNRSAQAMHGYLTRDGIPPLDFLRIANEELERYGIERRRMAVTDIACTSDGFRLTLDGGEVIASRTTLIATGVADNVPDIPGVEECYGVTVHHCPYCDGWEYRGRAIACYGPGPKAVGLAQSLRTWSPRLTACTDGEGIDDDCLRRSRRNEIALRTEPVARREGEAGRVRRVVFQSGPPLECDAVFFNTGQFQRSALPRELGCRYDEKGHVSTEDRQGTRIPGLFVIGDADDDVQFIVVAAAEGATAAVAINRQLQEEDQGEA